MSQRTIYLPPGLEKKVLARAKRDPKGSLSSYIVGLIRKDLEPTLKENWKAFFESSKTLSDDFVEDSGPENLEKRNYDIFGNKKPPRK